MTERIDKAKKRPVTAYHLLVWGRWNWIATYLKGCDLDRCQLVHEIRDGNFLLIHIARRVANE